MKKTFLSSLIVGLLLSAGVTQAADAPVAVVSIASVENVLKDANSLANIAGMGAEAAPLAMFGATAQGAGIDTKKPIGVAVFMGENGPKVLGFVPVTNFQQLVTMAKGFNMPLKDNGNGTFSFTGPAGNTAIVKEQNGWMFIARTAEELANVPADPSTLLGGLEKQYTIAIRGNLQNVPAPLREQAIAFINANAQSGMQRLPGEDDGEFMVRQKILGGWIKRLTGSLNETDQLTFGWAVDSIAKKMAFDLNRTAVAGSNLSKEFAKAKGLKSNFTGFLNSSSAGIAHLQLNLEPADIQNALEGLAKSRENAAKGIDNDANIPNDEGKKAVKEIVNQLFDVAKATIESGKLDAGATFNLSGKNLTFASGAYVADGAAIETALKKLVDVAKNEPDFPGINFNVGTHQGVRFHTTSLPNPDPQAKQVFGDKLDVAIGIGDKSVYLALGKDNIQTLKDIIDKSSSGASQPVLPGEFAVSLGQVFNFIGQFENNPMVASVAAEIAKANGQDHVRIQSKLGDNGGNFHIEIEEGVIRAIGAAAKVGLATGGGRGGFGPGGPGGAPGSF